MEGRAESIHQSWGQVIMGLDRRARPHPQPVPRGEAWPQVSGLLQVRPLLPVLAPFSVCAFAFQPLCSHANMRSLQDSSYSHLLPSGLLRRSQWVSPPQTVFFVPEVDFVIEGCLPGLGINASNKLSCKWVNPRMYGSCNSLLNCMFIQFFHFPSSPQCPRYTVLHIRTPKMKERLLHY